MELGELKAHQSEFAERNVRIVVASLEDRADAEKTKADFPEFTVVADKERKLASVAAAIHPHTGPQDSDTSAPATILVDRQGIVKWVFRPERFIVRLSPGKLVAAIDEHLPAAN